MKHGNLQRSKRHQVIRLFQHALLALMLAASCGVVAAAEKINLNTANSLALQYIPGIGSSKAEEIIRIRKQSGGFKSMDELLGVPGIGEKILLDVKKYGAIDRGIATLTKAMLQDQPKQTATAHKK